MSGMVFHQGPLPPAEELERLERVLPGSADRYFQIAEREQTHRHRMESTVVRREFGLRSLGQWLALAALCLVILAVCYIAQLGDTASAAAFGTATVLGVVAIFATGRRYDAKEAEAENAPGESTQSRAQLPPAGEP